MRSKRQAPLGQHPFRLGNCGSHGSVVVVEGPGDQLILSGEAHASASTAASPFSAVLPAGGPRGRPGDTSNRHDANPLLTFTPT